MKQRRVKKREKRKNVFSNLGYTLFTVSTMALHGDIVVEMPFPQCPPPLVNMFAVSVTTGSSQTREGSWPNRLACLARFCYWLTYSINSRGEQLLEMGSL